MMLATWIEKKLNEKWSEETKSMKSTSSPNRLKKKNYFKLNFESNTDDDNNMYREEAVVTSAAENEKCCEETSTKSTASSNQTKKKYF